MILVSLGIINALILLAISGLHFYWSMGGAWGFQEALPQNKAGVTVINPKRKDSLLVAFGLLFFAIYLLIKVEVLVFHLPSWVISAGIWVISMIFLLRALGDFNYVGLTKRIKDTRFARRDTRYYTPLCLFLGFSGLVLAIFS